MKVVRVYKTSTDCNGDNHVWEDVEVEEEFNLKCCLTDRADWIFIGNSAFHKHNVCRIELRCQKQQEFSVVEEGDEADCVKSTCEEVAADMKEKTACADVAPDNAPC